MREFCTVGRSVGHFHIVPVCRSVAWMWRSKVASRCLLLMPKEMICCSAPSAYDILFFFPDLGFTHVAMSCSVGGRRGGMFCQNTSAALTPAAESTPVVVNSVSVWLCLDLFSFFLLFSFLPLAVSVPFSHSSPFTPRHSISDPTPSLLLVCSLCVKMVSTCV